MKLKRSLTALLTALGMLLSMSALPALAEEPAPAETVEDNIHWEPMPPSQEYITQDGIWYTIFTDYYTKDQHAAVRGADAGLASITIPAAVREVAVTGVTAGAFSGCTALREILTAEDQTELTSIDGVLFDKSGTTLVAYPLAHGERYDVPEGTTSIASFAFNAKEAFDLLREVTLPEGLTDIGSSAFRNQAGLAEIVLPDSCKSVDQYAFENCKSLKRLHIGKNLQTLFHAFTGCTSLCEVTGTPKDFTIQDNVVTSKYHFLTLYPAGLPAETYTVPEGTTRLVTGAFEQVAALRELILPETVKCINDYAIDDMPALERITFPEGTTDINSTLQRCPALQEVRLPSTLKYTGSSLLKDTPALTDIYYNGTEAQFLGVSNVTYNKNILRTGVTIHYLAEEGAASVELTCGTLLFQFHEDHAELIGFKPTNRTVETLTIPAEVEGLPVTAIADAVFKTKANFRTLLLPETLLTIGENAFAGNTDLTAVTFPERMESIGKGAFSKSGLTSVTLPEGLEVVEPSAFYGCKALEQVSLPASLREIGSFAFSHTDLTEVQLPEGLTTLGDHAFFNSKALTAAALPESLTEMGDSCFYGCSTLERVNIPSGLTALPMQAFASTALREIDLPESVTSIGDMALCNCGQLENVTIRNRACSIDSYVTTICNVCVFYDDMPEPDEHPYEVENADTLEIHGWRGSTAQQYADAWSIRFVPLDAETVLPEPKRTGDLDGDGELSIVDVIILNKSLMLGEPLTQAQMKAADVDGDGTPDFNDSLAILKHILRMIVIE